MTATNLPATNTPHRFMISLRNYRSLLLLLSVSLIPITGCESVSGWYRHKKASPQKIVRQLPQAPSKNIDRAVIEKGKRTLTVYAGNQVVASYRIALGREPAGAKNCEGDYKTPEGRYKIVAQNPNSRFYRSLMLDYPNANDIAVAKQRNCKPGGLIAIHGLENGFEWVGRTHSSVDWTNGCVAVTNQEMDRLWKIMPIGTPVEIHP